MVMRGLSELVKEFEERTGAPPLSKLTEAIDKFPDEKRLTLIKQVLTLANKISVDALDLEQVVLLLKEVNSVPVEKLEYMVQILRRVESIMKKAPKEVLDFLVSLKEG